MDGQNCTKDNKIRTFRDLNVWSKAIKFVTFVYDLTRIYPRNELYGLSLQMRKCAISIPSNIAEGYGRQPTLDYLRFLQISMGSLYEVQTQLQISLNLKFVTQPDFASLYEKSRLIEILLISLMEN